MRYATLADLITHESLRDLAQAAAPDDPEVNAEALEVTIKGGSRARWSKVRIAGSDAAVVRLEKALEDADNEINGWIGGRYPDLPDPPGALKEYAIDISLYRLYGPGNPEDPRLIRYKAAIAYLREVARGMVDLSPPAKDPDTAAGVMATSPGRVFTVDALRGY